MNFSLKKNDWITIFLFVLIFISANILVRNFIQDDAYITFHYAANLANHGAVYYNVGEKGPIGFTNPFYVLLLSGMHLFSLKMIFFEALSRVLAAFSLFGILWIIGKTLFNLISGQSRQYYNYFVQMVITGFLLIFFPYFLPNFFSGLETVLFTFITFILLCEIFGFWLYPDFWIWVCLGIGLTLRMDAAVLLMPITGTLIYRKIIREKKWSISVFTPAGQCLLMCLAVAVFYLSLFVLSRHFLPLSFMHKKIPFFIGTVFVYLKMFGLVLVPLALLLFNRANYKRVSFLFIYAIYISLFYGFFKPWHFERYIFPFLLSFFLISFLDLIRCYGNQSRRIIWLCLIGLMFMLLPKTFDGYTWVSGYRVAMGNLKKIASALNAANIPESDRILASYDAGCIPYKTNWRFLDLAGLTTPEIYFCNVREAVLKSQPTVLIISGENEIPKEFGPIDNQRYNIPANYTWIKRITLTNAYWWPHSQYGYHIFVNEKANFGLIEGIKNISVDVENEMGYQKQIWKLLKNFAGFYGFV